LGQGDDAAKCSDSAVAEQEGAPYVCRGCSSVYDFDFAPVFASDATCEDVCGECGDCLSCGGPCESSDDGDEDEDDEDVEEEEAQDEEKA